MLIKKLIQRLLDSRTTPEEAAHNSAPGRIDIAISGTEYICPSDGYITASSSAAAPGGFCLAVRRNGLLIAGGEQEMSFANSWNKSLIVPMAKGDRAEFVTYNTGTLTSRFITSIGGV